MGTWMRPPLEGCPATYRLNHLLDEHRPGAFREAVEVQVPGDLDPPHKAVGAVESHILSDQFGPHDDEPCRRKPLSLFFRAVEDVAGWQAAEEIVPRLPCEHLIRDLDDWRGISFPTHLEEDPPPRPKDSGDAGKDPAVNGGPVQGGV